MKRLLLLPAFLLLASLSTGCAEDPATGPGNYQPIGACTPDDFQRPELEVIDVDGIAASAEAGPAFAGVLDGNVDENPTACDCTDESCVIDWIEDNMGCGVCVHMACGDAGAMGGCLPCPEPTPSEPARDNADAAPCVIAPVDTNAPGWDIQVQPSTDETGAGALPILRHDATLAQN